jgi:hypothetical protein
MNHQIKTDTVSMTTVTEGNVTDINTSITIKAPK